MWRDLHQRMKLRELDLQVRSAELRYGLAQDLREMQTPLRWADRAFAFGKLLRSLPRGWRAASAIGGLGGLLAVFKLFRRTGGLARVWAWLTLARRVWRWVKPTTSTTPTPPSSDTNR